MQTLLVDGNLNGDIQPLSVWGLLFRDYTAVLGIVLKSFARNETLENRRNGKVGVPKETKEGQDGHKNFNDDFSNSGAVINCQEEEKADPPNGQHKGHGRGILGDRKRLCGSIGRVNGWFGPGTTGDLMHGVVQDTILLEIEHRRTRKTKVRTNLCASWQASSLSINAVMRV